MLRYKIQSNVFLTDKKPHALRRRLQGCFII